MEGNPLSYADPTGEAIWIPIIIGVALLSATQSSSFQNSAANAAQYWANQHAQTNNPLYAIPGGLASLADPCNVNKTASILGSGAGFLVGKAAVTSGATANYLTNQILRRPNLLKPFVKFPNIISSILQRAGWAKGPLTRSQSNATARGGWKYSKNPGPQAQVQYHPGHGHHGPKPYYKVSISNGGTVRVGL